MISDDAVEQISPARRWLLRGAFVLFLLGAAGGLTAMVVSLMASPTEPRRQVARIAILPDAPLPPPPPPKEEPRKEQPREQTQQVQQEQPKPQDAPPPADQPIKMDGPAGDGPSAFAAGTVTSEYRGGAPTVGATASAAAGTGSDRAQERFYANSARQLLREAIEKHLPSEAGELTAAFSIWVDADGSIRRFELAPGADAARDGDLRSALDGAQRSLRLPPPGALAQPMRFRLTVRPLG